MKKLSLIFLVVFQTAVLLLPSCGQKGPLPSPDKTPPYVSSISPVNGTQDVPVNSSVMIAFSEAMDTSTINAQSITISDGSGNVPGSCIYTDTTAVFKPSSELNGKSVYTVTVDAGVKDNYGNAMGMPFTSTFITGTTPDRTPPAVSATAPADGATGAGVGTMNVTFSEPVDPQTILFILSAGSTNVPCTMTYNGTDANFTPESGALSYNTSYTARVSAGMKDLAGNPTANDYTWSFTTDAKPDTTPPRVIDVQPSNRKQNASPSTAISIMFSEPMDSATISTATIKVTSVTGDIPGRITYNGAIGAATFTPDNVFSSNTMYIVTVSTGVTDAAKNAMTNAFVSNFKTGSANDSTPPYVLTSDNAPTGSSVSVNTPIIVNFSEAINASTITPANIIVSEGGVTIPGTINYYGTTAVFTPNIPLKYATLYTVTINKAISDLAGNAMSADYTWTFTTEPQASDTVNPHMVLTLPGDTQNNVPVYKQIVAICSETMTGSSTGSSAFILADQNGIVPGEVAFRGAAIVFTPGQPLSYNTAYTATITSGATDVAGNPLVGNLSAGYAWSFTTEAIASFNITATAGQNGSISPSGSIAVNYDGNKAFTITPNAHYHIADVLVDGSTIGPASSYEFAKVIADHTISASFAIDTLTVTPSAGPNGSISPSMSQTVNYNGTTSFTLSPSAGYHIVTPVGGTCSGNLSGNTYTTNAVTTDCTVVASFAINTYTVTPSVSGGNGAITPATAQIVSHGSTTSFTLSPTAGYHAVMGGTCGGSLVGNTYTTNAVVVNCAVQASFAINTNTITTVVTSGTGTITPWNPPVNYGANQSFSITPATGFHVADVLADGNSVGAVTSYAFNNVVVPHTISTIFSINTYTITASAGPGGSITPSGAVTVNYGASQTFNFTPNEGYYVSAVTVDNVDKGLISSYTFTTVTAPHTIAVSFALGSKIIAATAGAGGTITSGGVTVPSGTSQDFLVSYNGSRAFTTAPNVGYHIVNLLADGVPIDPPTSYTFTNVTTDHTISATFAINTYTVTGTSGGNGTITPSPQTINHGATTTFTVSPSLNNHIVSVTGCGGSLSGTTYTTGAITAACTVSATFAIDTFTVTGTSGGNGTITPSPQTIAYNNTASFTVAANSGYHIVSVTGCGGTLSGTIYNGTYTTGPITGACTVSATFTQDPVNGVCGTSNGGTFITIPSTNLCSTGNASAVSGTGPWAWNCNGLYGGTTSSCSANIQTYTVTGTVSGNGTVTPTPQTINYGATTTFTVSPSPNNHIVSVTGCGGSLVGNTYTTGPITGACTVSATFTQDPVNGVCGTSNGGTFITIPSTNLCSTGNASAVSGTGPWAWNCNGLYGGTTSSCSANIQTYTVTGTVSGNGTVTPTPQTINYGATTTFTVSPSPNNHIVSVTGCGGSLVGNTYTTGPITGACTVSATFTQDPINGVCGTSNGGTFITIPSTNLCSTGNASAVSGTGPWAWNCNGLYGGTTSSCSANIQTYTVTGTVSGNGTVTPTPQTINYGATTTFTVSPSPNNHIVSVTGCGGSLVGNTYTTGPITGACTVSATFTIDTHTITANAGPHGDISPSGDVSVNHGADKSFTITPNSGYVISNMTVDGSSVALVNPYTFTNVTADHTISVNFANITHLITASAGAGGAIDPSGTVLVNDGASKDFSLTADPGYILVTPVGGTCGGTLAGDGITYTTAAVSGDCSVQAAFSPI